jgi:cold-inducible RNA-binding protein
MARKLFVGNLPFTTTEAELQTLFERAGTVDTVQIMRDMATGRARGFAFVEMGSDAEAQKAVDELQNTQLGGRTLTINEARPRESRGFDGSRGQGDGRGGRGGGGFRRSEPRW